MLAYNAKWPLATLCSWSPELKLSLTDSQLGGEPSGSICRRLYNKDSSVTFKYCIYSDRNVNKGQPRTGPASTPRARIGPACLSKALSSLGSKGVHEGILEGWHCGDRICRGQGPRLPDGHIGYLPFN